LPAFLAQAYNLKSLADYAVGSDVGVSLEEAGDAIMKATRFVDCIATLLGEPAPKGAP